MGTNPLTSVPVYVNMGALPKLQQFPHMHQLLCFWSGKKKKKKKSGKSLTVKFGTSFLLIWRKVCELHPVTRHVRLPRPEVRSTAAPRSPQSLRELLHRCRVLTRGGSRVLWGGVGPAHMRSVIDLARCSLGACALSVRRRLLWVKLSAGSAVTLSSEA